MQSQQSRTGSGGSMVSGASRVGSGAGANQASPTSTAAEKPKEVGRNYLKWNDMVYLVRVLSRVGVCGVCGVCGA
jgi:hypothetical protein